MLDPGIHHHAALDTTHSIHPNITFVSLLCPDSAKHPIIPVFKKLTTCFDTSRQSSSPLAHTLYRHQLTYHVLVSSILSPFTLYTTRQRIAW